MTTFTLRGDRIGEALQFQENGSTVTVEIGRVWFAASDIVTLVAGPGAVDPITGAFVGGAGSIIGMTVTTATGQVTTFGVSTANPLDVDPDQAKNGGDFMYVSESPAAGTGGAYAGLQLEKILVSDVPLIAGTSPVYDSTGNWVATGGTVTPPPPPAPQLIGTADNDVLTGTAANDSMAGLDGNDFISSGAGRDTVTGGNGDDVILGGAAGDTLSGNDGNDRLVGEAGNDRMNGGAGDDLLTGGAGADVLTGGVGGDTFIFSGGDRVTDFRTGEGDKVAFDAALGLSLTDIAVTYGTAGATFSWNGQSMVLTGMTSPIDLGNHIAFDYVPSTDFL